MIILLKEDNNKGNKRTVKTVKKCTKRRNSNMPLTAAFMLLIENDKTSKRTKILRQLQLFSFISYKAVLKEVLRHEKMKSNYIDINIEGSFKRSLEIITTANFSNVDAKQLYTMAKKDLMEFKILGLSNECAVHCINKIFSSKSANKLEPIDVKLTYAEKIVRLSIDSEQISISYMVKKIQKISNLNESMVKKAIKSLVTKKVLSMHLNAKKVALNHH